MRDLCAIFSRWQDAAGEIKHAKSFSEGLSSEMLWWTALESAAKELARNPDSGTLEKYLAKDTGTKMPPYQTKVETPNMGNLTFSSEPSAVNQRR